MINEIGQLMFGSHREVIYGYVVTCYEDTNNPRPEGMLGSLVAQKHSFFWFIYG